MPLSFVRQKFWDDMLHLHWCVRDRPDNSLDGVGDQGDGGGQVGQDHPGHDWNPELGSIPGSGGGEDVDERMDGVMYIAVELRADDGEENLLPSPASLWSTSV